MLEFGLASTVDDVIGALTDLEATQVPFAWTKALNVTAAEAQKELRAGLPDKFTLRRDWVSKGIRMRGATKARPVALVFTKDWFMADQEGGNTRRPLRSSSIYVPSLEVREGATFAGTIKPGMRPKTLLKAVERAAGKRRYRHGNQAYAKPLAFVGHTAAGHKALFIRRFPNQRLPIVLLYTLAPEVNIPPRWGFEQTANRVSDKRLRQAFIDALDHGLKTAKGGAIKSAYVERLKEHPGGLDAYSGGTGGPGLSTGVLAGMER